MRSKCYWPISFVLVSCFLVISTGSTNAQSVRKSDAPFLGWNSYDCYGTVIDEPLLKDNLDAFILKLKPHGYKYFVIDAGWYGHNDLKPGLKWPSEGDPRYVAYDEYGRFVPSKVLFPNGLKDIIEHAHKHGLKFGLHLMRGISREVVKKNLPIKGTNYFAADIANKKDTCNWSSLCYGVDMDKPGAQEYYDSVVELVAGWGVDFIKYDDIVHKPREIEAIVRSIQKSRKEIELSISPGGDVNPDHLETYKKADMIRITRDIWDLDKDIQITFERWEKMQPFAGQGFWLDMDMIPFGHIRINYPKSTFYAKSTRGYDRQDYFTSEQKRTFITQRAMAASPLFMGGSLTSSPSYVFELITNADMLECNQNGVTGTLQTRIEDYSTKVDVWKTPHNSKANEGWIGIFNRNPYNEIIQLDKDKLGLKKDVSYELYDIWAKKYIEDKDTTFYMIEPNDVVFIRYKAKSNKKQYSLSQITIPDSIVELLQECAMK